MIEFPALKLSLKNVSAKDAYGSGELGMFKKKYNLRKTVHIVF